jgi:hypothetical protein
MRNLLSMGTVLEMGTHSLLLMPRRCERRTLPLLEIACNITIQWLRSNGLVFSPEHWMFMIRYPHYPLSDISYCSLHTQESEIRKYILLKLLFYVASRNVHYSTSQ